MRKILLLIAAIVLVTLQSCSIHTETLLHKNAEATTEMNIDFREMMGLMMGMVPDSVDAKSQFSELNKLPTEWTSLYDFEKKERKKLTTDPDSVRLMKKMFLKANSENGEIVGISFKQDHFSAKDYEFIDKGDAKDKMPLNNKIFQSWDGKTLTIDTKNFTDEDYKKIGASAGSAEPSKDGEQDMMTKMMQIDITNIIKFETKIKSITGLHDWVQKVDDRTIKITYNSKQLADSESKFKNEDTQIVVVTE